MAADAQRDHEPWGKSGFFHAHQERARLAGESLQDAAGAQTVQHIRGHGPAHDRRGAGVIGALGGRRVGHHPTVRVFDGDRGVQDRRHDFGQAEEPLLFRTGVPAGWGLPVQQQSARVPDEVRPLQFRVQRGQRDAHRGTVGAGLGVDGLRKDDCGRLGARGRVDHLQLRREVVGTDTGDQGTGDRRLLIPPQMYRRHRMRTAFDQELDHAGAERLAEVHALEHDRIVNPSHSGVSAVSVPNMATTNCRTEDLSREHAQLRPVEASRRHRSRHGRSVHGLASTAT